GAAVPAAAVGLLRGAAVYAAADVDASAFGVSPVPSGVSGDFVLITGSASSPEAAALVAAGARVIEAPVAPLVEAAEVMDRLRSPGGCPWDAVQTHESLRQYLVEETYELLD